MLWRNAFGKAYHRVGLENANESWWLGYTPKLEVHLVSSHPD